MLERLKGKRNTSALLVGVLAGTASLDVSVVISQKIRKQPSSRLSNTTFGYLSKGCSIMPQGHVLTSVHSSSFCHNQNLQTTYMPLDRRIDKENVVHLHNNRKNNDILNFAGKWMKLENIILSEVAQTQKDNYHMYSLISGF